MKTYLDCIPCFFKQALQAARIAGVDESTQLLILNETARILPEFQLESTPPEMARSIYKLVNKHTGIADPYLRIKERSNRLALGIYNRLIDIMTNSQDRILTALELAAAGNIIDFGVKIIPDINEELEKILAAKTKSITNGGSAFFEYEKFKSALIKANTILYLADNAGEIVFDRILMEEIKKNYPEKKLIFAVKEKPAINDALLKDALDCGIGEIAEIISSGSDAPGTLLPYCSQSFIKTFKSADLIISKGQGNYESLSGSKQPIFYLLIAKCVVIAEHIGCQTGDIVLLSD